MAKKGRKNIDDCTITEVIDSPLLTEKEAADFCKVGRTIFRRAVTRGHIPFGYFPGSTRKLFHRPTLIKIIKSNYKKGFIPAGDLRGRSGSREIDERNA